MFQICLSWMAVEARMPGSTVWVLGLCLKFSPYRETTCVIIGKLLFQSYFSCLLSRNNHSYLPETLCRINEINIRNLEQCFSCKYLINNKITINHVVANMTLVKSSPLWFEEDTSCLWKQLLSVHMKWAVTIAHRYGPALCAVFVTHISCRWEQQLA